MIDMKQCEERFGVSRCVINCTSCATSSQNWVHDRWIVA